MNPAELKYNEHKLIYDTYLAEIEQRLHNNPSDCEALLHKAFMFYDFYQEIDEAEVILQSTLEKYPGNANAYVWNGNFRQFVYGDAPDAAKYFRKALELEPNRADCHALLAGALSECKDANPQEVEYNYRKSFELEPTYVHPRFYLAYYFFYHQRKFKEARHELEEALKHIRADKWPTNNPIEEYYESMVTGRCYPELKTMILDFIQKIDAAEAEARNIH